NFFQAGSLVLLGFILVFECGNAFANVYASQIKTTNPDGSAFDGRFSDGTGARISFFLNDDASAVTVRIKDAATGSVVTQIAGGAMNRGLRSVTWDGASAEASKRYVVEITAEQPNRSTSEWTVFFDSGNINIFTRGCDVVRDMNSPRFGLFYAPSSGGNLGKGITIYNPDGSFHDPFLVAADITNGGSIDWGSGAQTMFAGVLDEDDRFYVSAISFGEIRRLNQDNTLTTVITGLTNPKGLYLTGIGANRVLYICDDRRVVRATIGDDDVFNGALEVVGQFSTGFPRNIALDDDGFMYVSLRSSNALDSEPFGLNKYDISGTLPVTDNDAVWFLDATVTFRIADLEFDHGADPKTSTDDILYFSTRGGDGVTADGVWRVDDINFPFPQVTQLVDETKLYNDDSNINDRAAIAFDPAGNIILLENSLEHVFFLSPPGEGPTNSFTTTSAETLTVSSTVKVDDRAGKNIPASYRLEPNFPNPFNPSTTITYTLAKPGLTVLKIYDVLGKEVRLLVDEHQAAGEHTVQWDGKDQAGRSAVSGVYIVSIESGAFRASRRITLAK
ncbi:MAG: FlgD immunoglobulin-like domain containing protein, partial [bacterium]